MIKNYAYLFLLIAIMIIAFVCGSCNRTKQKPCSHGDRYEIYPEFICLSDVIGIKKEQLPYRFDPQYGFIGHDRYDLSASQCEEAEKAIKSLLNESEKISIVLWDLDTYEKTMQQLQKPGCRLANLKTFPIRVTMDYDPKKCDFMTDFQCHNALIQNSMLTLSTPTFSLFFFPSNVEIIFYIHVGFDIQYNASIKGAGSGLELYIGREIDFDESCVQFVSDTLSLNTNQTFEIHEVIEFQDILYLKSRSLHHEPRIDK